MSRLGTLICTAAQGDGDVDGAAVLTAKRGIRAGDEITISYIDEHAALADRQDALRDYGFTCSCPRCFSEQSAKQLDTINVNSR
jgi:hypothetical protein